MNLQILLQIAGTKTKRQNVELNRQGGNSGI
jgi:hypothetical protein